MELVSDYVPALKILSSKTINYAKYIGPKKERKPPAYTYQSHILSQQSIRKIRKAVDFMADTAKWKKVPCREASCEKYKHSPTGLHYHWFRLGFLTLTLPAHQLKDVCIEYLNAMNRGDVAPEYIAMDSASMHYSDEDLKSFCLNHFLTVLREKYHVSKYLWKAESQQIGNIHFHIVIDQFIHWRVLQYVWNRVLSKTNLIDRFEAKHGHRNPPTIEIHSVKKIESIRKYITAYIEKSESTKRKIDGRKWACSEELSRYDGITIELTGLKLLEFEKLWSLPASYKWYQNWFCVYKLSTGQLATVLAGTKILDEFVNLYYDKYGAATFNN